ncbi:D-glycero-beta-D-manno-heptose-1,7-bisphosphate 7-phosphatase [Desulfonema ishimotonii]|uniref:D,D-heptose 1,7-bisphosphate phosphatase n=2 Tax=Desulfonema ishimotonii TaxID=45657 RepID=A0A401G3V7_9BACT|nr:D-glycero-beta-D-manno-heptose 1,7-bisphosphate 7-phosphatase [Desulfonema ishimotonii]GBC63928.1 D-glycero-beta-D-manno-heptose-1,7-bisphosphate 7-phosphatase [Desulfonema ishimotonii]
MLRDVVFLDRDGVINEDSPDYIRSWDEFRFIPGSTEAIRCLTEHGFAVILITNQSAVNRGMITRQTLEHMHTMMRLAVEAAGGRITDIFFCPHRPDEGCGCRKPAPGLIRKAQAIYGIDPATACMVGDSAKDIECARNAGCARSILVRTGNGRASEKILEHKNIRPDHIVANLYEAAVLICGCEKKRSGRSAETPDPSCCFRTTA